MIDSQWPRPKPLGDTIRDALARRGITEEKANKLARRLGFSGCWCGSIRRWLNRNKLLYKIATWLGMKIRYLESDMY